MSCGHCKALAPEYAKAASKLKGLVKLVAVDCDDSSNRELCSRFDIKGFPTVKIFSAGPKGMPFDYQGERTAKAIVDTLTPLVPAKYVAKIGGSHKKAISLDEFKNKDQGKLAQVVLITDKKSTPILFKALSLEYLNRLVFGEIKSTSKDIIDSLGIEKFPTIIVFDKDGQKHTYDGVIKQAAVVDFLDKFAIPVEKKDTEKKKPNNKPTKKNQKKESPKAPFNANISQVTSQANLESECLSKELCIISFIVHEPEYAESTKAKDESIATLVQAKKQLYEKGKDYQFVWINPLEHGRQLIRDFGVSDGYPSMMAIAPFKKTFKLLRTAFEEKSIVSFLELIHNNQGKLTFVDGPILDKQEEKHTEL